MAATKSVNWGKVESEITELLGAELTATELGRKLFGPKGLFTEIGSTPKRRAALVKRGIYRQAQARITELQRQEAERFETESGAAQQRLSGRLTIQIPRSLHAALKAEALREGVSLAELIRLKLGHPYRELALSLVGALPYSAKSAPNAKDR